MFNVYDPFPPDIINPIQIQAAQRRQSADQIAKVSWNLKTTFI